MHKGVNKKNGIKLLVAAGILLAGVIVVRVSIYLYAIFSFANAMGLNDKFYTPDELITNFKNKQNEIYTAKSYINKIVPKYRSVDIEFKDDEEIARFVIAPIDTGKGSDLTLLFQDWNLKIKSKKVDSLLLTLNWTSNTLKNLKEKLDAANCISIASGEPAKIGFKRAGMGMYFFNVFDRPIVDSLKKTYNDSCTYIYGGDRLVLEYGGGAVGPQCFLIK